MTPRAKDSKQTAGRQGVPRRRAAVLATLSAEERAALLGRLLDCRPDLVEVVEQLAAEALDRIDAAEVAGDVAFAIESLAWTDIGSRSGRQPGLGYVHPSEAAWQMVEEAVQPFVDDIGRRTRLGMTEAAVRVALGVVAGIYDCRDLADGTVLGEAGGDEAAFEIAAWALRTAHDAGLPVPEDELGNRCPEWAPVAGATQSNRGLGDHGPHHDHQDRDIGGAAD